ncbi:hypothetical protein BHE74_00037458, partial [Ensete ventricosum]
LKLYTFLAFFPTAFSHKFDRANCIFWTRALNIPFPRSYVFPESLDEQGKSSLSCSSEVDATVTGNSGETSIHSLNVKSEDHVMVDNTAEGTFKLASAETVWVEGLVPGIDFCNHGMPHTFGNQSRAAAATWEVDSTGAVTGVPASMYLILGKLLQCSTLVAVFQSDQHNFEVGKEICISYGNKGNEELLYLYGFVVDNNPDDYLMVHYPIGALKSVSSSDSKAGLLEAQVFISVLSYLTSKFVVPWHTTQYGWYVFVRYGIGTGGTYRFVSMPHRTRCRYVGIIWYVPYQRPVGIGMDG